MTVKAVPVKKTAIVASIALIIVLGFAVYANSLNGKFVYDDHVLVENNAFIKEWPVNLKIFTADFGTFGYIRSAFYRPLQMVTYAIDYHAWKLNVVGYHLANVFWHILSALAVYWLISILFNNKILSALTALFFVAHPIHTGVVNYISSRADPMYLFFALISFIFYIKSLKSKSMTPYIIMIFSYISALLSKENSLILPALILLYHYAFKEKIRVKEFLSISGIALIYMLLRVTALKYLMTGSVVNSTLPQRIPGFFVAIATYIKLLLLPFGLHMEYGAPLFNLIDPRAICGIGILATLIFFTFKTMKANRLIFFSLAWFLITLIPVSNIYPINAYMAENWLYLPSIGFFLILASFLVTLYKNERCRALAITITVLLPAFYSYLTIQQNRTWKDPVSFYERTLKHARGSSMVYTNLGVAYYKAGKKEEAIAMYKKAIEANPGYAPAYTDLANVYDETGRREDAITMYKKAIEIDPNYAPAYNNLGVVYRMTGKRDDAIAMYKRAIEINPANDNAYGNIANLYRDAGKQEDAIAMYKKVLEINPDNANAYNNLGIVYYEIGKREDAIAMYKKALEADPAHVNARRNLDAVSGKSQ